MKENHTILIVEDEKNISDVIKAYMEKEGYNTFVAFDGEKAMEIFKEEDISLILLDLMIPKISGEELCSIIRNTSEVPIIMLTAKSDENSKIEGLDIGADDYVVKPFSPRELVSRVKALLRRTYRDNAILAEKIIFNGNLEIDKKKFLVEKNGNIIDLTTNEFKVLLALASNPEIVFTREKLIQNALGLGYEGFDRTIDTYIKNIRQKIEDDPKLPKYIITVYGVGYKFLD
ncbi:response regulator transcription factor [Tissierella creatinophila]|uniref:Transcriptional regulatory protein WalR n=1 Tax=Tissierella creatinophila DSM 6911 TaxID=1123403 RepID=A0A1U7M8N1_TISCR|nr:response regulator transcription factor [Tissierella creatinophila]OLS03657.1 transcriptional regulatory protein WalR [Tissierella creatinophila DSM 6911]